MKFGVVILGAGASRRMGRPKLLLPWSGTTVIGHLVREWTTLGATRIAIVLAKSNPDLHTELDRIGFPSSNRVFNERPEDGMFGSIRSAARWDGWDHGITHFVISLGDQPHLKQETLRTLVSFAAKHPDEISQPAFRGRPRHPVVLPKHRFKQLATTPKSTLAEFLDHHADERAFIDMKDPGLALDLDTPEDYEKARRAFEQG